MDNGTQNPIDLSSLIQNLTENKELMATISGIVGEPPKETDSTNPPDIGAILSNPDVLSKLPDVIATIRPFLHASTQKEPSRPTPSSDRRIALLCALKPYLSPRRCEAIDYFTKISKMGDVMKQFKP